MPAVKQNRSKDLSTSCQAVSRLGTSENDGVVVVLVMALLSFADSSPRAYRLKVGNASLPNSTAVGTFPTAFWETGEVHNGIFYITRIANSGWSYFDPD